MIKFEAGGKEYALAFGMRSLKAYQRAAGETATEAFAALEAGKVDLVRLSDLFKSACAPEITEEECDAMIDEIGITLAMELLGEAAGAYFGDPTVAPPAKSTRGSTSGSKRG